MTHLTIYVVAFLLAGAASGYCAGLFGIGGGILRIPIFVYLFSHFGTAESALMHVSEGTSLALVIPSAVAASWKQHRMGMLDLDYYRSWAIAILIGVAVGAALVPFMSTPALQIIFIFFLLLVAVYVGFVRESFVVSDHLPTGWPKRITAFFIGGCSVLIGIGGGAFTTPTLKACSYPLKKAIALATATTFVVGSVGTIGAIISGVGVEGRPRYALGFVDLIAFVAMFPVVLIFAPLGAKTANHLNREVLRKVYAVFLILMAGYMAYQLAT